jgi:hypothetical protein
LRYQDIFIKREEKGKGERKKEEEKRERERKGEEERRKREKTYCKYIKITF